MRIPPDRLRDLAAASLEAVGAPPAEAHTTADVLVAADLREVHSHGVLRLPAYVDRIRAGHIRPRAQIEVVNESSWLSVIDGHGSLGQVIADDAMDRAIARSERGGIGVTVVRNSNHFGMSSFYSMKAAERNNIGVALSNVAPLMPAAGGREKAIGNNPISIASPLGDESVVLDMALSTSSFGKILYARDTGRSVPMDWGVDAAGHPTSDPGQITDGGLLAAVGGPKGVGLAFMVEILTGVLSGGAVSSEIPSMYDPNRPQSIAHFMMAIDIESVSAGSDFEQRTRDLVDHFRGTATASPDTSIYLPGEVEAAKQAANFESGIDIASETLQGLDDLAERLGIDSLDTTGA